MPHPYEKACEDAIRHQGLDKISDALTRANIPHVIDQTGGFCMVLRIDRVDGKWLGVAADGISADGARDWSVVVYRDMEDDQGEAGLQWFGCSRFDVVRIAEQFRACVPLPRA